MAMGENDLHQIERRLHQPDVQVRRQVLRDTAETGSSAPAACAPAQAGLAHSA
jgi:hypothetical protein